MSTTMPTTMTMGTITTVITITVMTITIIMMGSSMMIIITPRMAAFITGKALPECMFRA